MNRILKRWLAVLPGLFLAAALCGCANGSTALWIPGLTLPKDTGDKQIVTQTTADRLEGRLEHAPIPGAIAKVLVVNFDNPHGWPTVAAHMDIILNDHGYRDTMGNLARVFAHEEMTPAEQQKAEEHWPDYAGARLYVKEKSDYVILLWDLTPVVQAEADKRPAGADVPPPVGAYTLAVAKLGSPMHIRSDAEIAAAVAAAKAKAEGKTPGDTSGSNQAPAPPPPPSG